MHELSLYANVAPSKHHQVLSILAGLTSMQPQPVLERRLNFIPTREPSSLPNPNVRKAATEQRVPKAFIDGTYRVQVAGDISRVNPRLPNDSNDISDFKQAQFTCEFKDFPEVPAKRPATSRIAETIPLPARVEMKGALQFMDSIGYRFVNEMIQAGQRFTQGNIDIRLLRTYPLPPSPSPLDVAPRDLSDLSSLDATGSYQMQATLMVEEDNKPEVMASAYDEMNKLRELLRGIADLKLGERLAMNTRIR